MRERDIFFTVAAEPSVPESVTKLIANNSPIKSKRSFNIDEELDHSLDTSIHT
jgi:hypothetical protein